MRAGGHYDVVNSNHTIGDQTGWGDCAPLTISKLDSDGGRITGGANPNNYWYNYRVDYLDSDGFTHLSPDIGMDRLDVDYGTIAASRTNPSRPYVDIPVNILELRDIGRTLMRQGFDSIAALGRQNLRYQFGIAPLIGDLVKLVNFQDQVQRRIQIMERLEDTNGYRRTLGVGAWSKSASYSRVMQSNQFFFTDTIHQTTTQRIRAHIRWLPNPVFRTLTIPDRQRLAMRAVLGLTVDASTLWNAIPWTWLVDWCSSAGDFFTATRNIIPATLSGLHIMRETRSTFRNQGNIYCTPLRVTRISKTRNPTFVAPVAHFPFLSPGQMSILGSLAVTRR
nr:MAG: hypothetical protein 1 [Leviviridae sp.]